MGRVALGRADRAASAGAGLVEGRVTVGWREAAAFVEELATVVVRQAGLAPMEVVAR